MCMQVWVPDHQSRMAPTSVCFFNDAAWLDAGDLRMVHPSIDNGTAELLGCKSLRIQHQVCLTLVLLANLDSLNMAMWGAMGMRQSLDILSLPRRSPETWKLQICCSPWAPRCISGGCHERDSGLSSSVASCTAASTCSGFCRRPQPLALKRL